MGLARVTDSTGQLNGHVRRKELEVGVDIAAFCGDGNRKHVRIAETDADESKVAPVAACSYFPPGSVGERLELDQRGTLLRPILRVPTKAPGAILCGG